MSGPSTVLVSLIFLTLALVATLIFRPTLTTRREGKILAFVASFILPVFSGLVGASEHLERSKQTRFCLSCHIMEPYGKSLYVDDPHYLAAAHFQNHRVPPDQVCYTCHTNYAMFGGLRAKLHGLRHVYVQYLGTPPTPEKIHLYEPYNNRECLHCHLGARSFEESPTHTALRDELVSNQASCLTSGCHDVVHNVAGLGGVKFWEERQRF